MNRSLIYLLRINETAQIEREVVSVDKKPGRNPIDCTGFADELPPRFRTVETFYRTFTQYNKYNLIGHNPRD